MNKTKEQMKKQSSTNLEGISQEQIERYRIALKFICPEDRVLDAACGTGYGSYLLIKEAKPKRITAIDRSIEAINHGKKFFANKRISYHAKDIYELDDFPDNSFDVICALEILEHMDRESDFLEILHNKLSMNGVLLISTPNETVIPFEPRQYPSHKRHYTSEEFIQLLEDHGFVIHTGYTQINYRVLDEFGGKFNIAVCKKSHLNAQSQISIIPYFELLKKEIIPSAAFFREFGGIEARRLIKLNWKEEALYLLEQWVQYDSSNPEVWYLCGYYFEKFNDILNAKESFEKAADCPINEDKKYIISSLLHLAQLNHTDSVRKEFLKKCLALEPHHQKAKEMLEKIEN